LGVTVREDLKIIIIGKLVSNWEEMGNGRE